MPPPMPPPIPPGPIPGGAPPGICCPTTSEHASASGDGADGRRWRSNPSGKCLQERLTRGTVTSTMRRAAHPSECARCVAGAGCSAIKYQSLVPMKPARRVCRVARGPRQGQRHPRPPPSERDVKRFRGGLVLKDHRLVYHSTLVL